MPGDHGEDHGPGIAAHQLDRIFERFAKSSSHTAGRSARRAAAEELKVSAHMTKPIPLRELIQVVRQFCTGADVRTPAK